MLTQIQKDFLDDLLKVDEQFKHTKLSWLRKRETVNSPKAILEMLNRLDFLKSKKIDKWNLSYIGVLQKNPQN